MSKKAGVLIGLVVLGGGFGVYKYLNKPEDFMYAGTLETTKVILSSKVGTDIVSLDLEEGTMVKKDETIAELNADSFKVASKQLDADYQRYKRLEKHGHATQEEFDKIERVKKENDLKIQWCQIKSPIDGIIITKFKENGEYLNVGSNIVSIADPCNIWAYFYVPYDMVHKLQVGGKVQGVLQELPDKTFEGTILKINEEAEFTPKNVQTREERTRLVYGVKVRFENKDLLLKSGMTMETSFVK